MWHTVGVDRLGVAGIGLTDGPSGARGSQFTGTTSTSLPCGTALASTWNRALIGRVGRLLGDEARSKGASVLLAPPSTSTVTRSAGGTSSATRRTRT